MTSSLWSAQIQNRFAYQAQLQVLGACQRVGTRTRPHHLAGLARVQNDLDCLEIPGVVRLARGWYPADVCREPSQIGGVKRRVARVVVCRVDNIRLVSEYIGKVMPSREVQGTVVHTELPSAEAYIDAARRPGIRPPGRDQTYVYAREQCHLSPSHFSFARWPGVCCSCSIPAVTYRPTMNSQ